MGVALGHHGRFMAQQALHFTDIHPRPYQTSGEAMVRIMEMEIPEPGLRDRQAEARLTLFPPIGVTT